MKPTHKAHAILLSLVAISLTTMSCERRGRAPVNAKETLETSSVLNPSVNLTNETENAPDATIQAEAPQSGPSTQSGEVALLKLAQHDSEPFNCTFSIDLTEVPSSESFVKDLRAYRLYRTCQKAAGVYASRNKIFSSPIRSNGLLSENNGGEKNADWLLKKFDLLASSSSPVSVSSEEKAIEALAARIKLMRIASDSMIDKYSELDPKIQVSYESEDANTGAPVIRQGYIGTHLDDIKSISESADLALANLQKMRTLGTNNTQSESK